MSNENTVGDRIAPALRQPGASLAVAASAELKINASNGSSPPKNLDTSAIGTSIRNRAALIPPPGSCKQILWFSFFFDGTGNNLDADLDMKKHSNVAKLFRVHVGNENIGGKVKDGEASGIYRIYVPGVGTYFNAIGDEGGMGGNGFGLNGDRRIQWALDELNKRMEKHVQLAKNPANAIIELNIAAFGFSRGSALARAFVHDLLTEHCRKKSEKVWHFKRANCPVRVRFLGLFDTVASAGLAASSNTVNFLDAGIGSARSHMWVRRNMFAHTQPNVLAFAYRGRAGADPNPGKYDGHKAFGGRMEIDPMVEDVRHFMAGHEYRNSFPVDSIAVLKDNGSYFKPPHFHEYIYPGVHSDVGGSYRPGEGGRNNDPKTKFGLITLRAMYSYALSSGVPLLPTTSSDETSVNDDFSMRQSVLDDFGYYTSKLRPEQRNLGGLLNAHMRLYYEWRFFAIRRKRKGDVSLDKVINDNAKAFGEEQKTFENDIVKAKANYNASAKAVRNIELAISGTARYDAISPQGGKLYGKLKAELKIAKLREAEAYDKLMRLEAKLSALPKEKDLTTTTDLYDKQLLEDAEEIIARLESPTLISLTRGFLINRKALRPHYRALVEAYENEFKLKKGLRDKRLIAFFDNYVHDSLSAFAKDGTLPSDPRVVYTGGDEKLPYAFNSYEDAADGQVETALV